MEIRKNENGQTILTLSDEEWLDYGREAGFFKEDMQREAMTPVKGSIDGFSEEQEKSITDYLDNLKAEVDENIKKLSSSCQALLRGNVPYFEKIGVLADNQTDLEETESEDDVDMWAKYPHLKQQQDDKGLLPPFDKA